MFKKTSGKLQQKIILLIEKIHLKFFGHPMSETMKNFLVNLSFVSIGMLLSSFLIFLVHLMAARFLGAMIYGRFQIIYTIAQFMLIPMLFGLNTATARYLAVESDKNKLSDIKTNSIWLFMGAISITLLLLFLLKRVIMSKFGIDAVLFKQAVFFTIVSGVYFFMRSILQGLKLMKILALAEFLYGLGIIIVFGSFILLGEKKIIAIYSAFLIGYGLFILLALVRSVKMFEIVTFKNLHWSISKKILAYAKYAILGSVSGVLLGNIDKIIIKQFGNFEDVGIYSVYLIASTVIFAQLVNIFVTVFFVQASASFNKRVIVDKLNKIIKFIFFVSALLSCMVIYGVLFIVGKKYVVNFGYLILFAVNSGLLVIFQIKMWFLNSEGVRGVRKTVQGTLFAGVLNLVLNLWLIPRYGIYGAISSTIFANLILYIYFTNQINKLFVYETEKK